MTDEIVKELEAVSGWFAKHGRGTNTAVVEMVERAIDFINRQQAEIERKERLISEMADYHAQYEEAAKKREKATVRIIEETADEEINRQKAKIERLQKALDLAEACIDEVDDALYRGEKNYYAECAIEKYKEMTEEIQND